MELTVRQVDDTLVFETKVSVSLRPQPGMVKDRNAGFLRFVAEQFRTQGTSVLESEVLRALESTPDLAFFET